MHRLFLFDRRSVLTKGRRLAAIGGQSRYILPPDKPTLNFQFTSRIDDDERTGRLHILGRERLEAFRVGIGGLAGRVRFFFQLVTINRVIVGFIGRIERRNGRVTFGGKRVEFGLFFSRRLTRESLKMRISRKLDTRFA
jgi:hypothetical protein